MSDFGEDGLGGGPDLRARSRILPVRDAGPFAGRGLDQNGVAVSHETLDPSWDHRDSILVVLDFLRNADDHARPPLTTYAESQ